MVLLSFPKKSRESACFSKFMLVLRVFCYHPYPGLSIFCHVPIFPKKGTAKLILQRITANVLTSAHLRSCSWFMMIYEQWVYIEYRVYNVYIYIYKFSNTFSSPAVEPNWVRQIKVRPLGFIRNHGQSHTHRAWAMPHVIAKSKKRKSKGKRECRLLSP